MKTVPFVSVLVLVLLSVIAATRAEAFLVVSNPPPSVQLAWDASLSPSVTNYSIYYGVGAGQYTNKLSAGTNLTFTVSNLVRGVTFYFAATATASNLESSFSNEVNYRPPQPPLPPNMRPLVILSVQNKPALTEGQWTDSGMDWTFPPKDTQQQFRLKIIGQPSIDQTNVVAQHAVKLQAVPPEAP